MHVENRLFATSLVTSSPKETDMKPFREANHQPRSFNKPCEPASKNGMPSMDILSMSILFANGGRGGCAPALLKF